MGVAFICAVYDALTKSQNRTQVSSCFFSLGGGTKVTALPRRGRHFRFTFVFNISYLHIYFRILVVLVSSNTPKAYRNALVIFVLLS